MTHGPLRKPSLALVAGCVAALVANVTPAAAPSVSAPPPGPPLVGFSFSPFSTPRLLNETPTAALRTLVEALQPDLVRLPIYWSQTQPWPDAFDYSSTEALIAVIRQHNRHARQLTRLVFTIGARNLGYPEIYLPGWLSNAQGSNLRQIVASPAYATYLRTTVERYADLPELYAWQVENEPLDSVTTATDHAPALSVTVVDGEIDELRAIDSTHPVVVTTFNSSHIRLDKRGNSPLAWFYRLLPGPKAAGHPGETLQMGNALGLDVYVVTPSTPLTQDPAEERIAWKSDTILYWSTQARLANKQLWITEMQGMPWEGAPGFTPQDLIDSASAYRGRGASVILLWGVESWLFNHQWMQAGQQAMTTLRTPD
ncbi:MAG: endo-1,4-beta-xylanase [Candidatus Dormibacteraeota bacterium]|nr:endo-1,4-beta-xylanase [Candidatus Dormibacteraeota bacterium]